MSFLDLRDLAGELDDLRELRDDEEGAQDYDAERLEALEELESELGDLHVASRELGPFIEERDFEQYAREFAEDMGEIPDYLSDFIDWAGFADSLKSDYSVLEFDGDTFYYRD